MTIDARPSPPLRVGIVVDSFELPAYLASSLQAIAVLPNVTITIVAIDNRTEPSSVHDCDRPWLFSVYQRFDRRRVSADQDPLRLISCAALLEHLEAVCLRESGSDAARQPPVAADTQRRLEAANLDVLLHFGSSPIDAIPSGVARCGVWRIRHGSADGPQDVPYFHEVRDRNPVTHVALEAIGAADGSGHLVLCEGVHPSARTFSQSLNGWRPYWASATYIPEVLAMLHSRGWSHLCARVVPVPSRVSAPASSPATLATSNASLAGWLAPLLIKKAARRLSQTAPIAYWKIGIRRHPVSASIEDIRSLDTAWSWIESPAGRFYADPFLLSHNGARWLFFEDYDYATARARISCAEVDDHGEIGQVRPALDEPYHLSYPCVFHHAGDLWMIPESKAGGVVALYRCRHFPDVWERARVLFDGAAVDTTPWHHDGRFWFFTTLFEPRTSAGTLVLFTAPDLEAPWEPHPASPLSYDVRNARGAGALVCFEGRTFRPSQDCSREYGYSFTFNEITRADRSRYEETPGATISPGVIPNVIATHTYSRLDDLEVIDAAEWISPADRRAGVGGS